MKRAFWAAIAAAGAMHAAQAQPAATASAARAADARPTSVAPYRSAFEGFQSWRDDAPLDWRRVNDAMRHLGGHAGHLRPPPADKPTPAHSGHGVPMYDDGPPKAKENKQ